MSGWALVTTGTKSGTMQARFCPGCGETRWQLFTAVLDGLACPLCEEPMRVERRQPGRGDGPVGVERRDAARPAARRTVLVRPARGRHVRTAAAHRRGSAARRSGSSSPR